MPVNADKPHLWKADVARSVDLYNEWFMRFAPQAYRETRVKTTDQVERALTATQNLTVITPELLKAHPEIVPMLRAATAPPIARDRLIGLAQVPSSLVHTLEGGKLPARMAPVQLEHHLVKIGDIIRRLADRDIFGWLDSGAAPSEAERYRAATIVADRLCGAQADPIIRNAQEQRQLEALLTWLTARGYAPLSDRATGLNDMAPGTFTFRFNVPVRQEGGTKAVNIPIDAVVVPRTAAPGTLPLLIEAKSAGDFTNPNKRRKEEATKIAQLKATYGPNVRFILFLSGYFDSGYLGYEAAEGIDWVWEHRIDDLADFGV